MTPNEYKEKRAALDAEFYGNSSSYVGGGNNSNTSIKSLTSYLIREYMLKEFDKSSLIYNLTTIAPGFFFYGGNFWDVAQLVEENFNSDGCLGLNQKENYGIGGTGRSVYSYGKTSYPTARINKTTTTSSVVVGDSGNGLWSEIRFRPCIIYS